MRKLFMLFAFAIAAPAQITTIQSTDPVDYRTLNANFAAVTTFRSGIVAPTALTCTAGKDTYLNTITLHLYWCTATNTWTDSTAAAGDLSGIFPAPVVAKINGTTVPVNSAADQVLITTGAAAGAWVSIPSCTSAGGVVQYSTISHTLTCHTLTAGDIPDLSATYSTKTAAGDLSGTLPSPTVAKVNGTSVPVNSAADQALITTGAATGGWVSVANCTASGGVLRYSTSTHAFSCATLGTGDIPDLSATYSTKTAGGDLSGTLPSPTVARIHQAVTVLTSASSPYTVLTSDSYLACNAAGGAVTITLPLATATGREVTVKKTDSTSNACTLTRASSDTIDGATTLALTSQNAAAKVLDRASGVWDRTHVNQVGGDVSGPSTNQTVTKVNGGTVPSSAAFLSTDSSGRPIAQPNVTDDGTNINVTGRNLAICTTSPCTTNTGAVLRPDTGVSGMGGGLSGVRSNVTMWAGTNVPSCLSTDAPNNTCGPGGAQVNGDQLTLTSIIGLWDYFLTANLPGWTVTKTQYGTDQSGVYPLWQYTFTPQAYNRVGLLSSGQHFEPGGVLALWRFMYIALGSSDPAFAPMRSVKYVVSPAGNPWGWSTIAAPNRGLNSRSVNLNHNHSYAAFWAISGSSDKGSAPNSEAETVAMDALMAASGAAFLFDAHDYGTDTGAGHDIDLFVPPYILSNGTASGLWPDYSAVNALVEYLSTATSTTLISTNNYEASWYNTAASLGIQAFNTEGGQNFGGALHSYLGSDYMTHYVKLVGNSILALSQLGPNEAHGIKRSDLPAPMFVPVRVLPSSVTTSRLMSFRNATGEAVASSVTDNGSSVYTAEKFGAGAAFSADPASPVQASADLNAANSSNPANYHFFVHAPTAANTEIGMCFGYTWTYKCNAAITHKFQGTGYGDLYFYTANSSGTWGKRLGIFASGGASLGSTTDPGSGIFNAENGLRIGGTALASTHLSDTASLIRTADLAAWTGSTNITTIGTQTTPTEWQTNTDSFGQNTASGFALVAHTNNNTNGSAEAGIAFGVSTTASVIGGAVTLERLGTGSYGNLWFYTKNSSQTFARRVGFMSSGGVNIGGSTDPGSGNLSVSGTIAPLAGTNTLWRCTVAGTLRVGEFTTVSADCGTAVDTGMRVQ